MRFITKQENDVLTRSRKVQRVKNPGHAVLIVEESRRQGAVRRVSFHFPGVSDW